MFAYNYRNYELFLLRLDHHLKRLDAAGVNTVPELAQRNPANLQQKLVEVNNEQEIVKEPPSEKQVTNWVAQAKELPRVITY